MWMPPFLDKACHIIPYTVRTFVLYYSDYANYINYITYTFYFYTVCLLNLHEDERTKPRNWIPVGWVPVYDESRDKRLGKGFNSTSARKIRLYHQCWIEFLDKWAETHAGEDKGCYHPALGGWSEQVNPPFHRWSHGRPARG